MTDLDLFKSEWKFTRGLTLELLDSLTDAELAETPNPDVGPFWKQLQRPGGSGGLAIHVPTGGELPETELDLWAITG